MAIDLNLKHSIIDEGFFCSLPESVYQEIFSKLKPQEALGMSSSCKKMFEKTYAYVQLDTSDFEAIYISWKSKILTITLNRKDFSEKCVYDRFKLACRLNVIEAVKEGLQDPKIASDKEALIYGFEAACKRGHLKVLEMLLENGVDIFDKTTLMQGFQAACTGGRFEVARSLSKSEKLDKNYCWRLIFTSACEKGVVEVVKEGLQEIALYKATLNIGFEEACEQGRLEVVEILLENGTVSGEGALNNGFTKACKSGSLEVVKRLLKNDKIKIFTDDVLLAFKRGHRLVVDEILDDKRFDRFGKCHLLINACEFGDLELVKKLLADQDIFYRSVLNGDSVSLEKAIQKGHLKVVKALLEDDRIRASVNNWEIEFAKKHHRWDIVKYLENNPKIAAMTARLQNLH